MVFSSVTFLFYFLPLFMIAYFAAPTLRLKTIVALLFSVVFYAWGEPTFVFVLLLLTGLNMLAALRIDAVTGDVRRTRMLYAVGGNIAVLVIFKYAAFLIGILSAVMLPFGITLPVPRIALPLGISFFTFHSLSYLIDVYRRRFAAVRDPVTVGLYIMLFPQLVAGPIVRYRTIARQLDFRRHTIGRAAVGARIFAIGLAQKVLIADQVSLLAEVAFDRTPELGLVVAWLGLLAYTIQIYFDFGGYSNMAIGLGLILGFTLPRNFKLPYSARSLTDFWRRWHMSLSSWLRDYLYIALGGSHGSRAQTYRNLVIVFLLCGLWHGASWNFLLWGAWHGAFLVIERMGLTTTLQRLPGLLQWVYTLLAVMGGWVLFRAADLAAAGAYYKALLGGNGMGTLDYEFLAIAKPMIVLALVAGSVLAVGPRRWRWPSRVRPLLPIADFVMVVVLFTLSLIWVGAGTYSPFLYFRF
jgi:alginate O-acetyltransferase complex protein AlgI